MRYTYIETSGQDKSVFCIHCVQIEYKPAPPIRHDSHVLNAGIINIQVHCVTISILSPCRHDIILAYGGCCKRTKNNHDFSNSLSLRPMQEPEKIDIAQLSTSRPPEKPFWQ